MIPLELKLTSPLLFFVFILFQLVLLKTKITSNAFIKLRQKRKEGINVWNGNSQ